MKTTISISLETTKLKSWLDEFGDDLKEEQEKEMHEVFYEFVNELFTEMDNLEERFLEFWNDRADFMNSKITEFSDIGNVTIRIGVDKKGGKE